MVYVKDFFDSKSFSQPRLDYNGEKKDCVYIYLYQLYTSI